MSKGDNSNGSNEPSERPWQTTDEAATEWGPENVSDLAEGTLLTTGKHSAFVKTMKWEDEGVPKTVDKYYAYLDIDGQILPTRINKFSMDNLKEAYGKELGRWHNRPVVIVIDRKGKWPFCVLKAKPSVKGKGAARKKA